VAAAIARPNAADPNRSGATYSSRRAPARAASSASRASSSDRPECSAAAGIPARRSPASWSVISAMSGDTTTVSPRRTAAGAW